MLLRHELKEGIREVIDNEIIDDDKAQNLSTYQSRQARVLCDILEPFSKAITELEGENYVTLSRVVPYQIDIKTGLKHQAQSSMLSNLSILLYELMEDRFEFIFNSLNNIFEPIFAITTLLDLHFNRSFDLDENKDSPLKEEMLVLKKGMVMLKQKPINETIYYLRDHLANDN